MTENIEVLTHSSLRITGDKIIYVDPFKVAEVTNDADYILFTHNHHDHFSPDDIAKVIGLNTTFVVPERMKEQAAEIPCSEIITVLPGTQVKLGNILVEAVPAYNIDKPFHPKSDNWVGYVLNVDGTRIYVAGDTDAIEENRSLLCDVAMIPIGGKFTMDAAEAAEFVNTIKPAVAIPIHYGGITGDDSSVEIFKSKLDPSIKVEVKMQY